MKAPEVPENISREDCLKAIAVIDAEGVPDGAQSNRYDLVHGGKRYPPKLVVSIANRFANGEDLDRSKFRGGVNTEAYNLLKSNEFKIVLKVDQFETAFNSLRELFLTAYPDFAGFGMDERYKEERKCKDELISTYKQEIIPKMESRNWELAGNALVQDVIKSGSPIRRRMKLVSWPFPLQSNYLSAPDDKANFARKVANLTDESESESLERRIEQFLDFFKESGKREPVSQAVTCSMVSFLLALNDSDKYLVLHSRLIKRIVERFDPEFSWNKQHIQAREIRYVNDLAKRVSERLSDEGWEPKDMLDVQFFFWKADEMAQLKLQDGKPSPPPRVVHTKIDIAKNLILYGPPGTGKTWHTVDKALEILDSKFYKANKLNRTALKQRFNELQKEKRIGFVTFHQSFSYEDFVEGLRASTKNGQIRYKIEDGLFKRMCTNAGKQPDESWVLIIDEINRGNIANILGELITLIEPSKRAGASDALATTLPYSKEPFSVPANLHIIGTMNTADRSLTPLDTALRRRFEFEAMLPKAKLLEGIEIDGVNIRKMLEVINSRIELLLNQERTLGHSFFLPLGKSPDLGTLKRIFKNHILPLLEEYFFEDWSRIRKVLGDDRKSGKGTMFYVPAFSEGKINELLGEGDENNQGLHDKVFRRNDQALDQADAYIGIYEEQKQEPEQETPGQVE